MHTFVSIHLIHNTRHLCTRFRIAGIKVSMSRGISGGEQVQIGFSQATNASSRGRVCLFYQNVSTT